MQLPSRMCKDFIFSLLEIGEIIGEEYKKLFKIHNTTAY
jgi:hypothetical protein